MAFIAGILRRESNAQEIVVEMLSKCLSDLDHDSDSVKVNGRTLSVTPSLAFAIHLNTGTSSSPNHPLILPEDAFDRQPIQDERYALVGDIRIDNRDELATQLGMIPAQFRDMADSDLFLLAWSAWETQSLDRIIGGFAVAIWDKRQQELYLVRDHTGERPVYYSHTPAGFAFASMPRALRGLPGVDTSLDEDHLLYFMALVPDGPEHSFFKNISLLPPAHLLVLRRGALILKQYWHPIDAPRVNLRSNRQYEEALLEIFDRAVKARLRTSGKVGSQLSGGLDSSSVTASAARLMGADTLCAFTAVPQRAFADENPTGRFGNEGPAAARLAAMYPNIDHVLVDPSGSDMVAVIEKTGRLYDMPVFNPTNQLWLNAIMDQARSRGINVLLQGVGGNATISFGGLIGLSDLTKRGQWFSLVRQVRQLRKGGYASWRGAAYSALGPVLPLALRRFIGQQPSTFNFDFSPVRPDRAAEHHLRDRAFQEFFSHDRSSQAFRRKMFDYFDAGFAAGGASLGWDMSLRDPTQDKRVYEFCFGIPIEQYLAEGQTRSLVRRTMRGRLPAETIACTTRGLQAADWFLNMGACREQMAAELKQIATSPVAQRLIDIPRLQRLLATWPSSGYERSEVYESWHLALGRGLAAGNFIRNFES